jgi:hypothetical protein
MVAKFKFGNQRGQAAIEAAFTLPFLIFLLYYTLNAFQAIHTSHVGEKYAAMNMYERLDNRAKFAVDDLAHSAFTKTYMAVQYGNMNQQPPQRRILLQGQLSIYNVVGICREPGCK